MKLHQDVIVIGGGISGTATAYELAKQGVSVTLLERGDIASMASGWTLAGVRQSGRHVAELPISVEAVKRWESLSDELDADIEYRQDGNLRLALVEDDVPVIQRVVEDGRAAGLPIDYIDGQTVQEIAPSLTPDVAGASFCATDGHANNHLTVQAYASAAERLGARILTGTEVIRLVTAGDRVTGVETAAGILHADQVIVAAGIYTPRLLAPLGLDLPLNIVLCPVVQTEVAAPSLTQVLGVASGAFAGRQEASGRYRLIGASEAWHDDMHSDGNTKPTLSQTQNMVAGALSILPALREVRMSKIWGGLIDRTPDVIPVIDEVPDCEGLTVAAGFSGHGFGIGPATGEILADLATKGTSRFDLTPFSLSRFATGAYREQELLMHG
jgi:sarcosine oxidase subunit beta